MEGLEAADTDEQQTEALESVIEKVSGSVDWRERVQKKFLLIRDWQKERKSHVSAAKALKDKIEGMIAEIEAIAFDSGEQLEIPASEPESGEPKCTSASGHKWERFREDDMLMEDCSSCGLERTARVIRLQDSPDDPEVLEHEEWIYTKAQGPAVPENEISEAEAAAVEEPVAS